MKISNFISKVSFNKSLVANCSVIKKDNTQIPCSVYNLTQKDDSNYFDNIPNKHDWFGSKYLCYLKEDLKNNLNHLFE